VENKPKRERRGASYGYLSERGFERNGRGGEQTKIEVENRLYDERDNYLLEKDPLFIF